MVRSSSAHRAGVSIAFMSLWGHGIGDHAMTAGQLSFAVIGRAPLRRVSYRRLFRTGKVRPSEAWPAFATHLPRLGRDGKAIAPLRERRSSPPSPSSSAEAAAPFHPSFHRGRRQSRTPEVRMSIVVL